MISFIVPVFRDTRFLERTIKSICEQTFSDLEIIIVDDSDDNSAEENIFTIKNIYNKKNNIKIIRTDDVGLSKARNEGIKISSGKYFVPLDPDDYISPFFIEKTLPHIVNNENLGFVYVNSIYTDGINFQEVPSLDYSFFNLMLGNFIVYCSLFNRVAFENVGGYDPFNFNYFEDYQFYLNLASKGWYGHHVKENLFYYTVRKDSAFQSEHTQKMSNVYKSFIITRNPKIFPLEWQEESAKIMSQYPKEFMLWNRFKQEAWLKENSV